MRQLMEFASASRLVDRMPLYASTIAFQWLMVCVILWRIVAHRVSLQQLGMALLRPAFTTAVTVPLAGLLFANQMFSLPYLTSSTVERDSTAHLDFVLLVVMVVVCVELIYQGLGQFVSYDLTALVSAGIVFFCDILRAGPSLPSLTWLCCHPCRRAGVCDCSLKSRQLPPYMLVHFITEVTVGLADPIRIRTGSAQSLDRGPITVSQ